MAEKTENETAITPPTNEASSILYQAIKDKKLDDIKLLLQDESLVNAPLFTSGPLAGYTALHVACLEKNEDLVEMLVEDYHADVNIVAEDKTQPIHLACLFGDIRTVIILLAANADIEAEITQDMFLKHVEDETWCDDFGSKITILTYAILYNNSALADFLIDEKANVKIKSHTNKTLLMYALEMNHRWVVQSIVDELGDAECINARDDAGYYSLYYLFHPKHYGDFKYDGERLYTDDESCFALSYLLIYNPDIYAMVNGNPETLLLNMVAYRSCPRALKVLLPRHDHLKGSKALYYATLPPEDPQKTLRLSPNYDEEEQLRKLEKNKKRSIEFILKDFVNRMSFGLPVPVEEKKLMNKLIEANKDIRELVHNYECNFINGELKNIVFHYGDKTMTYYEFLLRLFDDKKLQILLRNEIFMEAYSNYEITSDSDDHYYFEILCLGKIDRARKRIELLDKLKTVEQLRRAIPLPYESVLDIIDYLDNKDLKKFINTFFDIKKYF